MSEDPWKQQLTTLGALIRSQRAMADMSLRDLAERTEVSNAYLSQIERGLHEPSIRVLQAIAAALDIRLDLLLTHAGLLEAPGRPRGEGPTAAPSAQTEAAIKSDPTLTGPQKFALLSIYRSFSSGG